MSCGNPAATAKEKAAPAVQAVVEVQQQEATAVDAVAVPSQEVEEEAVEMVVEEPKEEELVQFFLKVMERRHEMNWD